MKNVHIAIARRGKVITGTKFSCYDHCLNSYVGCGFGCSYCYVRFFLKDNQYDWGEWVRVREHMADRLPQDLAGIGRSRLVLGTMTDPYQPAEAKYKITQAALDILTTADLRKVGIFTRSPLVLRDVDLIRRLPRGRVHFTIAPIQDGILKVIEPVATSMAIRFRTVKRLKEAGIRVHINVAPVIPYLQSEQIDNYVRQLAEIGVDEFFVDPMQPYHQSMLELEKALAMHPDKDDIISLMSDRQRYNHWKNSMHSEWSDAWKRVAHLSPNTMPIGADHEAHLKFNLLTGEKLDWDNYDSYEEQ